MSLRQQAIFQQAVLLTGGAVFLILGSWWGIALFQNSRMHPRGRAVSVQELLGCYQASWAGAHADSLARMFPRTFLLDSATAVQYDSQPDTIRIMKVRPIPGAREDWWTEEPRDVIWAWQPRSVYVVNRFWPWVVTAAFKSAPDGTLTGAAELTSDVIGVGAWPEWSVIAEKITCPGFPPA